LQAILLKWMDYGAGPLGGLRTRFGGAFFRRRLLAGHEEEVTKLYFKIGFLIDVSNETNSVQRYAGS
jgi:hypothetical protein